MTKSEEINQVENFILSLFFIKTSLETNKSKKKKSLKEKGEKIPPYMPSNANFA